MSKRQRLRKLNSDTTAGIATYVIMMLGVAFMLYLFGFQSMYSQWSGGAEVNGTGTNTTPVTDPTFNKGGIIEQLMNPVSILVAVGAVGVIGLIAMFITKTTSAVLQYVIPALILVALNIFVFPLNDISTHTSTFTVNGISIISMFLIAFFNIFYLISVVEFIRGPT